MSLVSNSIIGIPVIQNQQEFIIGVFTIDQIFKFTMFTERLIIGFDENNEPIYNDEIQRRIEMSRVEKIADFLIEDPEASFPTNIVLHIPIEVIESQKQHKSPLDNSGFLEIKLKGNVFEEIKKNKLKEKTGKVYINIIDGQHRIKGIEIAILSLQDKILSINKTLLNSPSNSSLPLTLERYQKRLKDLLNIELVVSFFINKSLEYQAMIFSTINRTQKRVSESLVLSLFGLTTKDSPYKTALKVVYFLNGHPHSPFYNRIKFYGGEYDNNQSPPLSQATMVKSVVQLISENLSTEAEKDRRKSRHELFQRSPGSTKFLPFREYYAGEEDSKISDIMFYYFSAVQQSFLDESGSYLWNFDPSSMKPTNILQTTVGYLALLDILVDILKIVELEKGGAQNNKERITIEEKKFKKETYSTFITKASIIQVTDLQRYHFTSRSRSIFYLDMHLAIWPATSKDDPRLAKLQALLTGDQ